MASSTIENGVYFIQNLGASTVIDLTSGSTINGTKTIAHHKRAFSDEWLPPQLWIIRQVGNLNDHTYTIQNATGRTFLTLNAAANQTPIEGFKANNTDNQKWVILRAKNGISYVIRNKATSTYIDLYKGTINGWAGSGVDTTNTHQLWLLVRV